MSEDSPPARIDSDSTSRDSGDLRDLPKWLTFGVVPGFGIFVIGLLVLELVLGEQAMYSGLYEYEPGKSFTWYAVIMFKEGPIEYLTVLVMVPAVIAALYCVRHFRRFPAAWLGVWMGICALGLVYYGGEELSWGHHIAVKHFGKEATPESETVLGFNEQGETNIHNLDTWYGKMLGRTSKYVVEAWCYIAALAMPLLLTRRKPPLNPATDAGYWFWPTTATVAAAAMVLLAYRPSRLYIKLILDGDEPEWLRQSELQEFYIACTLSIYVLSIAWRLRQTPPVARADR